jgi:hypothetical protein
MMLQRVTAVSQQCNNSATKSATAVQQQRNDSATKSATTVSTVYQKVHQQCSNSVTAVPEDCEVDDGALTA